MAEQHNGSEIDGGPRDEVLRKMGRNLLLFQKAEQRLKWLAERMHRESPRLWRVRTREHAHAAENKNNRTHSVTISLHTQQAYHASTLSYVACLQNTSDT